MSDMGIMEGKGKRTMLLVVYSSTVMTVLHYFLMDNGKLFNYYGQECLTGDKYKYSVQIVQ